MQYILISILFNITLILPCFASDWSEGENLIVKGDIKTDQWNIKSKESEHATKTLWFSKEKKNKDLFVVTIYKSPEDEVEAFRQYREAPSKKQCSEVKYEDLEYSHKGYPAVFWYTNCTLKDNRILKMINLAIKGKDSFYHLQKIWKYDVEEPVIAEWKNRIGQAYVCDTRTEENSCPEGYTLKD